jgi:hypothetical protein
MREHVGSYVGDIIDAYRILAEKLFWKGLPGMSRWILRIELAVAGVSTERVKLKLSHYTPWRRLGREEV